MIYKIRLIVFGLVTALVWAHLGWDYFHEGVQTHYILISENQPGISNWWGGIIIPLLTWFLFYLIQKRIDENKISDTKKNWITIFNRFFGAILFGIILSYLFTNGFFKSDSNIPAFMMLGVSVLSFFIPLYKPEYLLGFVLGMTYTFGPILPIGIGIVLMITFAITYRFIRSAIIKFASTIKG